MLVDLGPPYGTIDLDAELDNFDKFDSEQSLYHFLKAGWKYIDPAPWQDGWPIQACAEHLEAVASGEIRHLILNIPPRCSKSSLVSCAFPAWNWAQPKKYWTPTCGPHVQFLAASYAQKLAIEHSIKCRRLIKSPWYQKHWGKSFALTADQDAKMRFENDKGGYRFITSVDSGVTGSGGQCFVAGTMVQTPLGPVAIEHIRRDQEVFSFDVLRGEVVKRRVVATASRESHDIHEIRINGGLQFRCTGDHPIYTQGQRYVAAGALGGNHRVLRILPKPEWAVEDSGQPSMQPMRRNLSETAGGFSEEPNGGGGEVVLLAEMPVRERGGQATPVRGVRGEMPQSGCQVLLGGVQGETSILSSEAQDLPALPCEFPEARDDAYHLLHSGVRGRRPQRQDARIEELPVRSHRGLLEPVSAHEVPDIQTRRKLLLDLWRGVSADEVGKADAGTASRSPHRREHPEQLSAEPDHALPAVPQVAPSWEFVDVRSVEKLIGEPQRVYDIQVEGCHNFFAEGILAHNCIIIDDPNDASDDSSEASIDAAIRFWDGTISTRLNDPNTGSFIVVQQRIAEDDITGHILTKNDGDWCHVMLPMFFEPERSYSTLIGWKDPRTEPGELLWPERFSEKTARALEKTLGPFRASGQLQQSPEPKGGGIIKREWWLEWDQPAYPVMDFIMASVDTAYTEKTMNDPSAMTVWGVFTMDPIAHATRLIDAEGRPMYLGPSRGEQAPRVMLMAAWSEHLEFHALVERVAETCRRFGCDKVLIEAKASGHSVAQELRRLYGHEKFAVQLMDPKSTDKIARLYSVQHLFADGMIYAPDRKWADELITEVAMFPHGKHDDRVDTVSQALRHMRDLGLMTRAAERLEEIEESRQYVSRGGSVPLYPG